MTDLTITKEKLKSIGDTGTRHTKRLINDIMESFSDSPETAYPLAVGFMVAIAVNNAKGPDKQNFVRLLSSTMAGCGFVNARAAGSRHMKGSSRT